MQNEIGSNFFSELQAMFEDGSDRDQILTRGVLICPFLNIEDIELFAASLTILTSRLLHITTFKLLEFPTTLMRAGQVITAGADAGVFFNAWATAAIMVYNGGLNFEGRAAQLALRGLSQGGVDAIKVLKIMVAYLQVSDFSLTLALLGKNRDVLISHEGVLAARLPTFPEGLKSTGFLLDQRENLKTAGVLLLTRFVQTYKKINTMLSHCKSEAEIFNAVCFFYPKARGLTLEWSKLKSETDILMSSLFEAGMVSTGDNLRKSKADFNLAKQITLVIKRKELTKKNFYNIKNIKKIIQTFKSIMSTSEVPQINSSNSSGEKI